MCEKRNSYHWTDRKQRIITHFLTNQKKYHSLFISTSFYTSITCYNSFGLSVWMYYRRWRWIDWLFLGGFLRNIKKSHDHEVFFIGEQKDTWTPHWALLMMVHYNQDLVGPKKLYLRHWLNFQVFQVLVNNLFITNEFEVVLGCQNNLKTWMTTKNLSLKCLTWID